MRKRRFAKLKSLLYEQELTQDDAARAVGRGKTYIARRMNGHEPWTFEDAEKLGGLLGIPRSEWVDYFTEGGDPGRHTT